MCRCLVERVPEQREGHGNKGHGDRSLSILLNVRMDGVDGFSKDPSHSIFQKNAMLKAVLQG